MLNCVLFDEFFFFTSTLITDSGDYTITKTSCNQFCYKRFWEKMFQCSYLQLRHQHHKLIYHQMLELFGNRNLFTGVAFKFFTVLSLALSSFFCLFTFIDYLCPARTCGPSPAHILHPWTARPVLSPLPFSSLRSFGSSLSSRSLIPLRTWRAWKWLLRARFLPVLL